MDVNTVFVEDCRTTLSRPDLRYDYVFGGPPDMYGLGLGLDGVGISAYQKFLRSVYEKLNPQSGLITIGQSDRRGGGRVWPKHVWTIQIFEELGYELIREKIWCKTLKCALRHLTFTFFLTFRAVKSKSRGNQTSEFRPDVWVESVPKVLGAHHLDPVATPVVSRHIAEFTQPGQVVYDPFFGTGSTALACLEIGRGYIGSEISPDQEKLFRVRLERWRRRKRKTPFFGA